MNMRASLIAALAGGVATTSFFLVVGVAPVQSHEPPAHGAPTTTHAAPAKSEASKAKAKPAALPAKPVDDKDHAQMPEAPKAPVKAARPAARSESADDTLTAEQALKLLQEGNARWVSGDVTNPNIEPSRRQRLSDLGQKPFVTVITCADSRLPVERVFDRGVGEVFTIRVAGNIAGTSETGTVEYGLEHLKTPLLVVMGHTKCGAVGAAASGAKVGGKVADIIQSIMPAVERTRRANPGLDGTELAAASVKENVWQTIFDLMRTSDECREMIAKGHVRVVGAVCDISTGKVEWMGEHPWQSELLRALSKPEAVAAAEEKH